ncbi:MAG: hypothetical protein ABEJ36_02495 [Candidatus Nanosalina sp.]
MITEPDFDEQLNELGTYLPAEDPEVQEAVYGLEDVSRKRSWNLERLGDALENDKFNRAQGLYMREEDFSSEFSEYFTELDDLMREEDLEAVMSANKLGMALRNQYHKALQKANIAQEGASSSMIETALEKGSI